MAQDAPGGACEPAQASGGVPGPVSPLSAVLDAPRCDLLSRPRHVLAHALTFVRAAEETSRSPASWPLTVAGSRSGVVKLPLVNPHATSEVRHGTHHPVTSCALCLTSFCRAATRWTALWARGAAHSSGVGVRPSARSGRWVQPPFRPPSPLSGQLLGSLCVIFRLRPRNPGCSADALPAIAQGCGRNQPKQSSRTSLRYIGVAPRRSATPGSGSVRCYATMQTDFRRMVFPSDFAWT